MHSAGVKDAPSVADLDVVRRWVDGEHGPPPSPRRRSSDENAGQAGYPQAAAKIRR
jgi:hypothetical protein